MRPYFKVPVFRANVPLSFSFRSPYFGHLWTGQRAVLVLHPFLRPWSSVLLMIPWAILAQLYPPTNHLHNSRSPSPGNCFVASKHHLARRTDPVLHSGKSPVPCVTWWINPSSSQTFLPVLGVPRWCKANPPAKAAKASPTENRFCIVLLLCSHFASLAMQIAWVVSARSWAFHWLGSCDHAPL